MKRQWGGGKEAGRSCKRKQNNPLLKETMRNRSAKAVDQDFQLRGLTEEEIFISRHRLAFYKS